MKRYFPAFFLAFYLIVSACKLTPTHDEVVLSDKNKAVFLNKKDAGEAITNDATDSFFNKINILDMAIQMKKPVDLNADRTEILKNYQDFLKNDVVDFTNQEKEFLTKVLLEAFQLSKNMAPNLFPPQLKIIKTIGKHYGDDTYYTRENCIVIPENVLKIQNHDDLLHVMLHEISHIITRQNPLLKAKLYGLIGFKSLANPLIINDSLKRRLLLNPDGVDYNWSTTLTDEQGKNTFAVPLIYTNDTALVADKKSFMNYLKFNFFEIESSADGHSLQLKTIGNLQQSTLNTTGITTIFKQNFNTEYIIHPDEIIADNYMLLVYAQKKPDSINTLTEGGKTLLNKMKETLISFKN